MSVGGPPVLHETNARVLVGRQSQRLGRTVTLASVPDAQWRDLARRADLLWLMGAWQRSAASRAEALARPELRRAYDEALPGWSEADVAGSPYAVASYALDPVLGDPGDLLRLRSTLARHDLGLVLDFVPNHVARDHRWTLGHPEWFVEGSAAAVAAHPDWFFRTARGVALAHGKDPHFPPWTDTAQLNFGSAALRRALTEELMAIAEVADAVRCDMAMLALGEVFERVWGWALPAGSRPAAEFWEEAIATVKARHPAFLFLAEAYWGLEARLLDLGFDWVYDKTLYDLLRDGSAEGVRRHLAAAGPRLERGAHFVENHDEPRALAAFGSERARAAAVVVATLPGLCLVHDGQLEGSRVRLPVQLVREPPEAPDAASAAWQRRLLEARRAPLLAEARWTRLEATAAGPGDDRHAGLLAWSWDGPRGTRAVVVNFGASTGTGRVRLALPHATGPEVRLRDPVHDAAEYVRSVEELRTEGLWVALAPWASHVLDAEAP